MPVGWFIVPSQHITLQNGMPGREPNVVAFTGQIVADGGGWRAVETLGDQWIVKVRASDATLTAINQATGNIRIPARFLDPDVTLGDLTTGERNAINTRLLAMGFTQTQITNAIGNTNGAWRAKTLRQVFNFARSRWRRPVNDGAGGITFETVDWNGGAPGDLQEVHAAVSNG